MIITDDHTLWSGFLVTEPEHITDAHERFSHNPDVDMVFDFVQKVTFGRFDGEAAIMIHTDVGVFVVDRDLSR
jgi:hypothetical protein